MPEGWAGPGQRPGQADVSAPELCRLRRALLIAERLSLLARLADNRARSILLALEAKYGLVAAEAKLDIASGRITRAKVEDSRFIGEVSRESE